MITDYIDFKKELKKYEEIKSNFNNIYTIKECFENSDLLISKFQEIKSLEKNYLMSLNDSLEEVLVNCQKQLKKIYSNKMNFILSSNDYDSSLLSMKSMLSDLDSCSSVSFSGLLSSFITDVSRVISNYDVIYYNYHALKKDNTKKLFQEDPLFKDVLEYAILNKKISISLLQKKFQIGYNRALKLLDTMEKEKMIGPKNGNKPRDVYINCINCYSVEKEFNYFSLQYDTELDFIEENILHKIDNEINGYEFEKITKELLLKNGFHDVVVTQASNDFGVDVLAVKDEIKYAIQCKKYASNVGVKAVQEVIASKSMHNCHVAVVLTNNYFTKSAEKLAEKNNVLLWDRNDLIKMIDNLYK